MTFSYAEHLDKMGNTVLLYVADCSLFNEQRIYCETKIENAITRFIKRNRVSEGSKLLISFFPAICSNS